MVHAAATGVNRNKRHVQAEPGEPFFAKHRVHDLKALCGTWGLETTGHVPEIRARLNAERMQREHGERQKTPNLGMHNTLP